MPRPRLPTLTRRAFTRGALFLPALGAARRAFPAEEPFERRFLFFYAWGGWDPVAAFDPHVGGAVDMEDGAVESTAGGITFTGGPNRPNLTRFLRRWAPVTCFVNGIDAHTVGHETGALFTLTGTGSAESPDWGTLIAASSRQEYAIPYAVLSGPAYSGGRGDVVVRGGAGTLLTLLDHSFVGSLDDSAAPFTSATDRLVDAYLEERAAGFAAEHAEGQGGRRAAAFETSLDRARALQDRVVGVTFNTSEQSAVAQTLAAVDLFRMGLSRCAMVAIEGVWDTHTDNSRQGDMIEDFFGLLDEVVSVLAASPGRQRETMLQETTLVALSDFGRTPRENDSRGKDHWPYGSALLCGSGIRGGQRVGVTDEGLMSQPIDFETGQASSSGDIPAVENLGAALLQLGGIQSEDWLPGVQPLAAVIR